MAEQTRAGLRALDARTTSKVKLATAAAHEIEIRHRRLNSRWRVLVWNGVISSSTSRHGGLQTPTDTPVEQTSPHGQFGRTMLATAIFHLKDKSGVETGPDGAVPYNCGTPYNPLQEGPCSVISDVMPQTGSTTFFYGSMKL